MRPEGGQHDRCGILSREEERADDRGEGAVQGKVVPLHSISKAQAGTPVRGDTTAGIVSTEACRRALLRFHKFSARLRGSRLVPEADMASQRSYTTGDASQVREANDVFRPRDG